MKLSIAYLLIFSALSITDTCAQSYYAGPAQDAPGSYRPTYFEKSGEISSPENNRVSLFIDALVDGVKQAYIHPVGADVSPYGGFLQDRREVSEFPNGPYTFFLTVPFFNLYNKNSGGVEASGESASSLEIWINSAKYILGFRKLLHGNDRIYRNPVPGISVEGFPKYNNLVVMTLPGKSVPWRPATKQDYLENLIAAMQAELRPTSLPTLRDNISKAQNLLASMSASQKSQTAYLRKSKYVDSEFEYFQWAGFQTPSDTTAESLVIIDENFYDKSLPRSSIQLVAIDRKFGQASHSGFAATTDEKTDFKQRQDRINNIVRNPVFLHSVNDLIGQNGMNLVANRKKITPTKKYVFTEPHIKNIDRTLDSMFRSYNPTVPSYSGGSVPGDVESTAPPVFPARNEKKLALAARKLNSTQEVVGYIDELEKNLAPVLAGAAPKIYDEPATNNLASTGYWLIGRPREALILALKAAKQEPNSDVLLNNLGATLGLCGAGYLAVPLHIVCIKKEPGNSTITNNLGQAYLEMGDQETAISWLRQALSASPTHHHANNSMGYIYQKQGRMADAVRCFENSLKSSFTIYGYNGLKALKKESALNLIALIHERYKQPDYINFDKYKIPDQCLNTKETELRIAEHKIYNQILDADIKKFERLKLQQKPIAEKSLVDFFNNNSKGSAYIRSFQPFATAMVLSIRHQYERELWELRINLIKYDKERERYKIEYDSAMKQMLRGYEPRLEAEGEGNADVSLPDEICDAKNEIANFYLPLMAENNLKRFKAIVKANKDFLNDYLYWIRFASATKEIYQSEYYDLMLTTLRILKEVRLSTFYDICNDREKKEAHGEEVEEKEPDCPFPVGLEIPFVVGKATLDCEGWGIDVGEVIKIGIEHKFGGETTVAFGLGGILTETPHLLGKSNFGLNPGFEINMKMQGFITVANGNLTDWGGIWEAEVDARGLGKGMEVKQNFTVSHVKGFTAKGIFTDQIDKMYKIVPEKQVNKNVKIYKPQQ